MISIEVDGREVLRMLGHMEMLLLTAERPRKIMETVGAGVAVQTKHRIASEKTAPDGTKWRPWSPGYAATRGAGHSLLIDTRDMLDGIRGRATGEHTAIVSSDRPYSGYHQFGSNARPFLGLSDENASDIESWMQGTLLDVVISGAPVGGEI